MDMKEKKEHKKRESSMISFECDYTQGAHGKVMERLMETNLEQVCGYGSDHFCQEAREKIKKACDCPEGEVFFLVGGTQTNQIVIDSLLQSYEGVIAATTGHVAVHEAGAIEFTGHKVLTVPSYDGKLKAEDVKNLLEVFHGDGNKEHMVFPGMVYISYPTEYGSLYSKSELTDIHEVCKEYQIPLYVDGARLGYGLMSSQADITMADLAKLCDVFYIGGTKVGALCGEAVVFTHKNMPKHFLTIAKQHGGLLAKGRLLGVQFDTLFTDDLYLEISKNAIDMAEELKAGFQERGYKLLVDSPTNQQFVILSNEEMKELAEKVRFEVWEPVDGEHTAVRFATSWGTTREQMDYLWKVLDEK